jgi:hypothetical protein
MRFLAATAVYLSNFGHSSCPEATWEAGSNLSPLPFHRECRRSDQSGSYMLGSRRNCPTECHLPEAIILHKQGREVTGSYGPWPETGEVT